jgi:EAL domain-containing protein (putative c-di-GMP-specific phosphodiesterase class I)
LKIDHSFVRGPDGSLASPAIVQALITVAKSLGVDVVAEGVETPRQASSLTSMGCRLAQGYLFSRALDAEAAWDFLIRNSGSKARR